MVIQEKNAGEEKKEGETCLDSITCQRHKALIIFFVKIEIWVVKPERRHNSGLLRGSVLGSSYNSLHENNVC